MIKSDFLSQPHHLDLFSCQYLFIFSIKSKLFEEKSWCFEPHSQKGEQITVKPSLGAAPEGRTFHACGLFNHVQGDAAFWQLRRILFAKGRCSLILN